MAEHHFQHEGYECIPNIILLATHLAGLTKRLRFGCGFNVLPRGTRSGSRRTSPPPTF